jgi:hypothetical protein
VEAKYFKEQYQFVARGKRKRFGISSSTAETRQHASSTTPGLSHSKLPQQLYCSEPQPIDQVHNILGFQTEKELNF